MIMARRFDARNVEVQFRIAQGYYMYRERFSFSTQSGQRLSGVEIPRGKPKEDAFGESLCRANGSRAAAPRKVLRRRALVFSVFLGFALPALADEAAVRRMVQDKLRGSGQIASVQKAPFGDLYEVVIGSADGPQVYYVDSGANVIISGQMIEAKSGRNLTEERQRKLNTIKWSSLPFGDAITTMRGTGRRKIAVFSDPNCPYCKRFEKDLARLNDITVHIFLYPVIKPESVTQTKSVWCSTDRAKAWADLMLRDIPPSAKPDCDTPVEKLVALGHKLGASSTPTWFVESGERYQGALPVDEVTRLLDAASPAKR